VPGLEGAPHTHQEGFAEQLPAPRGARSLSNPVGVAFDGYVNFGPAGVAAVMFVLGYAVLAVHGRASRSQAVSSVALWSGLSAALAYGALAGIAGVLLQFGAVTVALMAGVQWLAGAAASRRAAAADREGRALGDANLLNDGISVISGSDSHIPHSRMLIHPARASQSTGDNFVMS
jgi:hypothetical protein